MNRALIVTPAPPGSRAGNRNTAVRWARILRGFGLRVTIATEWSGAACELFVALHARRSHAALAAFRAQHPRVPAVLALTGTDLYRDLRTSAEAKASLELADRLVVLQEEAPNELDARLRTLVRVIWQSELARAPWRPPRRVFRLCVLGHLREEKDPLRAARALALLPREARIELVQAGKALNEDHAEQARALMRAEPRYRWIGEIAHWRALRLLAASHAMVISSLMEGGAHVVSEAIAHGVPVLASDIAGNIGMLGRDYPGYYATGDERALAALIERSRTDPAFLAELARACAARRPLIAPERERQAWGDLLEELGVGRR